ncbi:uncharacterized protein MYCFIDRAFT_170362 [Pseudocercospora fijiensis CIRAD86]|uniref:Uncharacterized protein n=1 Tax=Pseudocercospora fijiensis (strain CIRAD86) TaxID=383855 RepID=N1QAD5_PSEFD|nr:uncharacterized protein MYCFIDRAFT_170362 [Pseudocercospora fijiensis CIRAD86]EME88786.1 hypothetical protein MYCFIDRAFT_170362 [Pseudocercospora fijiensis CIRAD86]
MCSAGGPSIFQISIAQAVLEGRIDEPYNRPNDPPNDGSVRLPVLQNTPGYSRMGWSRYTIDDRGQEISPAPEIRNCAGQVNSVVATPQSIIKTKKVAEIIITC